jgi:hypothetical protein
MVSIVPNPAFMTAVQILQFVQSSGWAGGVIRAS